MMRALSWLVLLLLAPTACDAQEKMTATPGDTVLVAALAVDDTTFRDTITTPDDSIVRRWTVAERDTIWHRTPPPPPPPTLTAIVLSPASASLQTGGSQAFTAATTWSDGGSHPVTLAWSATGGTVSQSGTYGAGSTAGSYQVIAAADGQADTAAITLTAPPPPTFTTYFSSNAENGAITPPWPSWGTISHSGGIKPVVSTVRAKSGTRSIKYEVPITSSGEPYSMTQANNPTPSMGGPSGHFMSGWWSFWLYVDEGFDQPGWKMLIGWQTGVSGAPSPISHFELISLNGKTQLEYVLKNCAAGPNKYPCPTIPGYTTNGGYYRQTASSPNGITEFPRGQWVHLSFHYVMATSNGRVEAWQNGVKVMDLTAPTMNTMYGHSNTRPAGQPSNAMTNAAGDMNFQFGPYGQPQPKAQRMYVDDFVVTDQRVTP